MNLTAFPKANLTVRLIKNQPDSLIYFQFGYYFSPYGSVGLFVGEPTADTTFQVETAAFIYTQFHWTKYYGIGQYKDFSDSVICSAKHDNVFTLNY